jgi:hypothetical protein
MRDGTRARTGARRLWVPETRSPCKSTMTEKMHHTRDERGARDGARPDGAVEDEGEADDWQPGRDETRHHQLWMLGAPRGEGADVLAAGAVPVLHEPSDDPCGREDDGSERPTPG